MTDKQSSTNRYSRRSKSKKKSRSAKQSNTDKRIANFLKVHAKARYLSYEQKRMYSRRWKAGELNTVKMYDEIQKCIKARLVVGAFLVLLAIAACVGIYQLIVGSLSY